MKRTTTLAIALITSLTIVACGSSTTSTPDTDPSDTAVTTDPTTTAAPTTIPDAATMAALYTEAGPYPVGVTSLELAAGNKVEVWYPAIEGTTGTDSYDVRDFIPEAISALLTADVPAVYEYPAGRDAGAATGTFPVVLFSHGYSGIRFQSTFLTAHLASWGIIVASPDHWSRDLFHTLSAPIGDRNSSVTELLATLDLVSAENVRPGSRLEGMVDAERVVAMGHSAGGGTILGAALDDRIDGYISLASGALGMTSDPSNAPALPDKPSFFIAGALDAIISAEESTRPSFEAVPGPSRLWIIDGVGHNGFDDFCTFGNGSGIIGVAVASGLGPLLEGMGNLKRLGEDGCLPPAQPVDLGFPIIRHAVVAQLRFWFGDDASPMGLDVDVADQYELAIDIDSKD